MKVLYGKLSGIISHDAKPPGGGGARRRRNRANSATGGDLESPKSP